MSPFEPLSKFLFYSSSSLFLWMIDLYFSLTKFSASSFKVSFNFLPRPFSRSDLATPGVISFSGSGAL